MCFCSVYTSQYTSRSNELRIINVTQQENQISIELHWNPVTNWRLKLMQSQCRTLATSVIWKTTWEWFSHWQGNNCRQYLTVIIIITIIILRLYYICVCVCITTYTPSPTNYIVQDYKCSVKIQTWKPCEWNKWVEL